MSASNCKGVATQVHRYSPASDHETSCSVLVMCTWWDNKVRELILEGLFIINLYQLDKQSTKFSIWKYWKGCVKKVSRKRPELFANNSWILHHDNTPAHTALSVREFLATKQITLLEHPAYSPDLGPVTFSVLEDKGNIENKAFWWHWWHQE